MRFGFGTARGPGGDWSPSAPPSAPRGLSAVPKLSSSCPACWLSVAAFPPRRDATVGDTLRCPCGTMQRSDFSRPLAISFSRPRWLPPRRRDGGQEISLGKSMTFRPKPTPLRVASDGPPKLAACGRLAPTTTRLLSVSLSLGSAPHPGLPPDPTSRPRPCPSGVESPSVRAPEGLRSARVVHLVTFKVMDMPDAPHSVLRPLCLLRMSAAQQHVRHTRERHTP